MGGAVLVVRLARAPYELHRRQEADLSQLSAVLEARRKNQSISDALLSARAMGMQLFEKRVPNAGARDPWKAEYKDWERATHAVMEEFGCSNSETHGFIVLGPTTDVHGPKDIENVGNLKGRLNAQLEHLAEVAKAHDTARPV
jgi:hypothetical protein